MHKFSSIERFRNTIKTVTRYSHERGVALPVFDYIGTVKLHGTNAGIRRSPSGELYPQSRSRILSISSDNYGFAMFVEKNKEAVQRVFNTITPLEEQAVDITLYGEWVGEGIQSNVAIGQLEKHLVLFNVKFGEQYDELWYPLPTTLQDNDAGIYNIFQIPHYTVRVDFAAPDLAIHEMNRLTDEIEESCPWGKFRGVEGVGEGLVWVPQQHPGISDLWFKTKGGKHSGKPKVKGIKASVNVEKAANIAECLELVLPEWRLQQGVTQLKEDYYDIDHKAIGPFLKWVSQDVLKEEIDTIIENGLEWKDMHKPINVRARSYILNLIENDLSV